MQPPTPRYFEALVYKTIYPNGHHAIHNFHDFVRRRIIPEVRNENVRYYGTHQPNLEEELDALYPGHDYSTKSARVRLGQWYNHKKLFRAFDKLNLTCSDIHSICVWEGTRSAKERYEEESDRKVLDTTFDGIASPIRRTSPKVVHHVAMAPKLANRNVGVRTSVPSRNATKDYYSDPNIWASDNLSPRARAEAIQATMDQVIEKSPSSTRSNRSSHSSFIYPASPGSQVSQTTPTRRSSRRASAGTPQTNTQWNNWMESARQNGAYLPTGQDAAWMASHIPTHYAYATPAYHYGPHSPAPAPNNYTTIPFTPFGTLPANSNNIPRPPQPPALSHTSLSPGYIPAHIPDQPLHTYIRTIAPFPRPPQPPAPGPTGSPRPPQSRRRIPPVAPGAASPRPPQPPARLPSLTSSRSLRHLRPRT